MYRRDDWSADDLAALTRHLNSCAECRQIEASYRTVGESIRQLPSITPPPAFREAVFAAIRADQKRVAPAVVSLSSAATNPSLRVVQRPTEHSIRSRRGTRSGVGPRTLVAAAAVLLVSLAAARVVPLLTGSSLGQTASNLGKSGPLNLENSLHPQASSYAVDSHYAAVTSALATTSWLVYSATDASRGSMLFAEQRQSKRIVPLVGASLPGDVAVRALTDQWAVWSTGAGVSDGRWALYASKLSAASAGAAPTPLLLVDSGSTAADVPVTLGGVWARGETVLVAGATAQGDGVLLRISLSSGVPVASVVARTASGHLPTNPSSENGAYYWGDVWLDATSGLHGAIWRGDDAGHDQRISADERAFHPVMAGGELAWVEVAQADLLHTDGATGRSATDAELRLTSALSGALVARDERTSQQWQIAGSALADSLQASGPTLLWRDNTRTHLYSVYNVATRVDADVAQLVRTATFASATDSAVVWAQAGANTLYVSATH